MAARTTLPYPDPLPPLDSQYLAEFFDSRGRKLTIDREKSVVGNVKLMGWESKNGRQFGEQARRAFLEGANGASVNLNHHATDLSAPRDIRDRFGKVLNPRMEADGIFGDIQFNPKHEHAEAFLWNAEHSPESCGISPVYAPQKTSRTREGKLFIESLKSVRSYDLVADPATTASLKESIGDTSMSEALLAETLAAKTDLEKQVTALTAQVGELTGKNKTLAEQVETLTADKQKSERASAVSKFIAESKLPADAVLAETRTMWESVEPATAEKAVKNFAEAYHRGSGKPKSDPPAGGSSGGAAGGSSGGAFDPKSFASKLKKG